MTKMQYLHFAIVACSFLVTSASDLVIYNTSTQAKCTEVERRAVYGKECGWYAGLYRNVDEFYLKGRIAAYKIQWFNGGWSQWFVPGVNDLDIKFNIQGANCKDFKTLPNSMRRWWSYFYDHTHKFILCQDSTPKEQPRPKASGSAVPTKGRPYLIPTGNKKNWGRMPL